MITRGKEILPGLCWNPVAFKAHTTLLDTSVWVLFQILLISTLDRAWPCPTLTFQLPTSIFLSALYRKFMFKNCISISSDKVLCYFTTNAWLLCQFGILLQLTEHLSILDRMSSYLIIYAKVSPCIQHHMVPTICCFDLWIWHSVWIQL